MQLVNAFGMCNPQMQNTDGRTDLRRTGQLGSEPLVGKRAQGGQQDSSLEVDENGRYPVVRTRFTEERQMPEGRRMLVLRRDRFRCVICGADGRLEVDHIIPWSAGGSDEMDNLRTLCHKCNQERSNFKIPLDDCRRLPTAHECVYCNPELSGEPGVTAVHCIQCNKKAPGMPYKRDEATWPEGDTVCDCCAHKEKAHVEGGCFGNGMRCTCTGFGAAS